MAIATSITVTRVAIDTIPSATVLPFARRLAQPLLRTLLRAPVIRCQDRFCGSRRPPEAGVSYARIL